ncbi:MAG: hypothetical protein N2652_04185 [Kiritimatiellae bacterium]|nr:hypothetical protein [Kiritimatiellia bacterium]
MKLRCLECRFTLPPVAKNRSEAPAGDDDVIAPFFRLTRTWSVCSRERVRRKKLLGPVAGVALSCMAGPPQVVPVPPPGIGEAWLADPLAWVELSPTRSRVEGRDVQAEFIGPVASNVIVQATVVPRHVNGSGWCVVGLSIRESNANQWRLNLVQSPPQEGRRRFFELGQALGGEWPSSHGWRVVRTQIANPDWQENEPLVLRLELGDDRVFAEIRDVSGQIRLLRECHLESGAVRRGRAAIHAHGIAAEVSDVRVGWSNPIADPVHDWPPYASASFVPDVTADATGTTKLTRDEAGRWWAVDPLGRGFVILGVDHVKYHGHWCEALGYAPYGRKNDARYPRRTAWEEETLTRLRSWGFNALGAGCDPSLWRRGLSHMILLALGESFASLGEEFYIAPPEGRPGTAFPNVYHPNFAAWVRYQTMRRCVPNRRDPWLIGYFLDNELAWWGRWTAAPAKIVSATGLFDAAMRLPASHTAKQAACALIRRRANDDLEAARRVWTPSLKSWEQLASFDRLPSETADQIEIKSEFLRDTAEHYFRVLCEAVRSADPEHLILGARFAGTEGADPIVWRAAGRHCDVVSFNIYPFADLDTDEVVTRLDHRREPLGAHLTRYYELCGRPLLITEWSFPALDSGLPCLHGAGQRFRTQAERARASELFARTLLSLPFVIGYNYFMWVDEPALGISARFPEDSNYGLVNEENQPYQLLTSMFERLHRDAGVLRRSPPPPPRPPPHRPPSPSAADYVRARGGTSAATVHMDEHSGALRSGDLLLRVETSSNATCTILWGEEPPVPLGTLSVVLELLDDRGRSRWVEAPLASARKGEPHNGTVSLQCAFRTVGPTPLFECDVVVLAAGGPWLACELSAIRNTGASPLRVNSIYLAVRPAFEADAHPRPRNLWKAIEADAWIERGAPNRFWGAIAPPSPASSVRFLRDTETGRLHPDARWILQPPLEVPAKQHADLTDRPWFIVTGGTGGAAAWKRRVNELALPGE